MTTETIRTAQQLKYQSRRLDRLNAKVATVLAAMRHGAVLHAAFVNGQATWRLSTGLYLDLQVAHLVASNCNVVGVGDALPIIGGPCQTYRYVEGRRDD
jgi:hypothetical protein